VYVGPFESGELGKSWNAQGSLLVHFSTISSSGSCAFLRHTPSRMLKKSASGVLALLRGSTYRGGSLGYRNHWRGISVRQDQFKGRTAHTKCGLYLIASSLAAALLDDLFEHPASVCCSCPRCTDYRSSTMPNWFFRSLLEYASLRGPYALLGPAPDFDDCAGRFLNPDGLLPRYALWVYR